MEPTILASLATDTWLRVSAAVFRVWLRVCPLVLPCGQQERIFVGMVLMLIFGEALALYGLIVAIVIVTVTGVKC